VRALDATLCLAQMGANDLDPQRVEGAAELGHAVAAESALTVGPNPNSARE
jgi:hypothetical protein